MRILVIGKGVIGTIYSYLFHKNGVHVEHYVRQSYETPKLNVELDLLDEALRKIEKTKYVLNLTNEIAKDYDLVLVSVHHYQLKSVIEKVAPVNIPTLIFGNVWDKLSDIRGYFPSPDNVIFGMPRAGGAILNNKLRGAILREVILEERNENGIYGALVKLFQECSRKVVKIEKMQDWYWTHLATTVAWICGGVKARGFDKYSKSPRLIYESLQAGNEAIEIAKRRGADITVCNDVKPFLLPKWISTVLLFFLFRSESVQRISSGHGEYAPKEMIRIYEDIVKEGKNLNCEISKLESYKRYFDLMNTQVSH